MVLVAKIFEKGPTDSRGMCFQGISVRSTVPVDLKARRAGVNHGLDGDRRLVNLVMTGACLSCKQDRVVCNQEGAQ